VAKFCRHERRTAGALCQVVPPPSVARQIPVKFIAYVALRDSLHLRINKTLLPPVRLCSAQKQIHTPRRLPPR